MRRISKAILAASLIAATDMAPARIALDAEADLRNTAGVIVAYGSFVQRGQDLYAQVSIIGMRPGRYAAHLHNVGRCLGPGFESAGAHWNPTGRQHGSLNSHGPHLGDLPNIDVGANGVGAIEFTIRGASLRSGAQRLLDADGAALVIHAAPDDYRTEPSGNSGARIACGAVTRPQAR